MILKEVVDNTEVMACRDISRIGLQDDDMCVAALSEKLTKMVENRKIPAQKRGMVSGVGTIPPDEGLPREAKALVQLIPRDIGGLELLGAAAQGEWCAAVGQVPVTRQDRLTTHLAKRQSSVQALSRGSQD